MSARAIARECMQFFDCPLPACENVRYSVHMSVLAKAQALKCMGVLVCVFVCPILHVCTNVCRCLRMSAYSYACAGMCERACVRAL